MDDSVRTDANDMAVVAIQPRDLGESCLTDCSISCGETDGEHYVAPSLADVNVVCRSCWREVARVAR